MTTKEQILKAFEAGFDASQSRAKSTRNLEAYNQELTAYLQRSTTPVSRAFSAGWLIAFQLRNHSGKLDAPSK